MHPNDHNLPTDDEGRSELALLELLTIMFGPVPNHLRIRAGSLILRYCCPLSARERKLTITSAEDWLDSLITEGRSPMASDKARTSS